MILSEIITNIRREIREPSPMNHSDDELKGFVLQGMQYVWDSLILADDKIASVRAVLAAPRRHYLLPPDFEYLKRVYDPKVAGYDITSANVGSTTELTIPGHDFAEGNSVIISSVEGIRRLVTQDATTKVYTRTRRINGMHEVTSVNGDDVTFSIATTGELKGTPRAFRWKPDYREMCERSAVDSNARSEYAYFLNGNILTVDYPTFASTNNQRDVVIEYIRRLTDAEDAVWDIPDKYHPGLVSYGVIRSIVVPAEGDPLFSHMTGVLEFHTKMWEGTLGKALDHQMSSNPKRFPRGVYWDIL